jgi:hypothetical protein
MTAKPKAKKATAPKANQKEKQVKVYEPHAGFNDDPADSQADMDPSQKEAATLADGKKQTHANVRKTATRADGPDTTGVKVAD